MIFGGGEFFRNLARPRDTKTQDGDLWAGTAGFPGRAKPVTRPVTKVTDNG
jgi:hypothetical protein